MRGQNENFSRNRCLMRKKKENSIRIYENNLRLREDHKQFLKKKKKKKLRELFLEHVIVRKLI